MTPKGLVGYAADGTNTFAVNASDGSASFTGAVTATSGTFTGAVYANTGTFTGVVTATSGSFTGAVYASSGSFTGAVTATSGSFTGAVYASSGTFAGSISASGGLFGGYYTDAYTWPGAGAGGGFVLNSGGLLLGNYNSYITAKNANASLVGKGYVQLDSTGNISMPGFYVQDGAAVFSGTLTVGNAETAYSAATGVSSAITGSGAKIYSNGTFALGGTTSSIVGNGSAIYLNGPVVYNGNLQPTSVSTGKIVVGAVTGTAYGNIGRLTQAPYYYATATTTYSKEEEQLTVTTTGAPFIINGTTEIIVGLTGAATATWLQASIQYRVSGDGAYKEGKAISIYVPLTDSKEARIVIPYTYLFGVLSGPLGAAEALSAGTRTLYNTVNILAMTGNRTPVTCSFITVSASTLCTLVEFKV